MDNNKNIKYKIKYQYLNKIIQQGGGCADLYCILCGGPTYSREVILDIKLLLKYLGKDTYYGINPDGFWGNAISLINHINIDNETINKLEKSIIIPKNHKWQNDLMLLTPDGIKNNVKSCGEQYTTVYGEKKTYTVYPYNNRYIDINSGYLMHKDCYKLLIPKFGKFTFDNIDHKKLDYQNVGGKIINRYQGQFFYSSLAFIDDPYLLESPLKNIFNKKRILKLKFPIIKNKPKKYRPSPNKSATEFTEGVKKKGNDGNIWIIKKNKNGVNKWIKQT